MLTISRRHTPTNVLLFAHSLSLSCSLATSRPNTNINTMMFGNKADNNFSALSFPCKLYALLEDAESRGFDDVIGWQSGGKSFKIYKPEAFADQIMGGYFAQTKFKSFQRQLNIYGWKKVHHGPNKGGYVHKFFVRGQSELCSRIVRRTSKDMNIPADRKELASAMDPLTLVFQGEKVFVAPSMTQVTSNEGQYHSNGEEAEIEAFYDFFHPSGKQQGGNQHHNRHTSLDYAVAGHFRINTQDLDLKFDGDELDGFVSMLNHESDHSAENHPRHPFLVKDPVLEEEELGEINTDCEEEDELEKEHSFPFKLHLMLDSAERDNYNHIVSWVKAGKAFKVHNNKDFVQRVLPIYFDQSKYESFRRQLNLYNFTRVARGVDRGVISHPCFRAGNRDLCRDIKRKQQGKSSEERGAMVLLEDHHGHARKPAIAI